MTKRHRQTLAVFADFLSKKGWQKQSDLTAIGRVATSQRFLGEEPFCCKT